MTRKIFTFTGTTPEWLEKRRGYLTATDMASIFQIGSKSVAKVIEDKISTPEPIKNEFMTIGNILEPAVLKAFQLRAGIAAEPADPNNIVMVTDEEARIAATPDGKYYDGEEWHLIECKTTGSADLQRAKDNFNKWRKTVPPMYLVQVHTQMLVTGLQSAFIGCMSYFYPLPFICYQVSANQEIQDILRQEAQRFWDAFDTDGLFTHPEPATKQRLLYLLEQSQSLHYLSHEVV